MKVNKLSSSKCRVIYRKIRPHVHICVDVPTCCSCIQKKHLWLQEKSASYFFLVDNTTRCIKLLVTHNRDEGEKPR